MDRVKIGVFGIGRGSMMIKYCGIAANAELVAICDQYVDGLERTKKELGNDKISYYTCFKDFLEHDMDAVFLANYATEHAPYAIQCLKKGLHVFSEVLPVQTMQQAVELVEAVEKSNRLYAYAENYCFMPVPREMRRLYRQGALGEFEYGEGEYIHNCEPIWAEATYGDPNHWRNHMYANFYCTHSIGPLIHITGLRPKTVVGFELPFNKRTARMGRSSGCAGIEMITLENNAVIKSIHGDLYKNSVWYSIYGSKGRMESEREDCGKAGYTKIYVNCDQYEGEYPTNAAVLTYEPKDSLGGQAKDFGHGSSDFYAFYNFVEKILGNPDADTIDVYEALDMFLPGLFAYRSVMQGGIPLDIPDLRLIENRELFRYDTQCTDPKVAGRQLIPSFSKGNPDISEKQYKAIQAKWEKIEKKKFLK